MKEKFTQDILRGKNAWLVAAHPDDSLWHTSVIREAARVDERLLTAGEKGINPERRIDEEIAAAKILGIKEVVVYDGHDEELSGEIDQLASRLVEDVLSSGRPVDVLIGNLFSDHHTGDHLAAGEIVVEAARRLAKVGRAVGVLLLNPDNDGEYTSRVTPADMEKTFRAARKHRQWRMHDEMSEDSVITPAGYSMHREDYEALQRYPLTHDASYTWLPPKHFTDDQSESLALAAR